MEVQKHPHHVNHKKKWSEYLLEFLMLFLAVFLGFIAENQREHIMERERENKFAHRLLSDLCADSVFLHQSIDNLENRNIKQGQFMAMMTDPSKPTDSAVLERVFSFTNHYDPAFTTTTYGQMKTSGSLRYIQDDSLTNELQYYYEILVPKASADPQDLRKVFTDILVPYYIRHIRFQDFISNSQQKKYLILNRTSDSDQELINIVGAIGAGWGTVLEKQKPALEETRQLIAMIKKDYQLK